MMKLANNEAVMTMNTAYESMLAANDGNKDMSSRISSAATDDDIAVFLRYVFTDIHGLTPIQVYNSISNEFLDFFGVRKIAKKLKCPSALDPEKDLFYIAQRVYPEAVGMSKEDAVLFSYQRVISGRERKFPKKFFAGKDGMENACIILRYVINQCLNVDSIEALYLFFADTPRARRFLEEHRLSTVCKDMYDLPLDFLYDAIEDVDGNKELYYQYALFCQRFGKAIAHHSVKVKNADRKQMMKKAVIEIGTNEILNWKKPSIRNAKSKAKPLLCEKMNIGIRNGKPDGDESANKGNVTYHMLCEFLDAYSTAAKKYARKSANA